MRFHCDAEHGGAAAIFSETQNASENPGPLVIVSFPGRLWGTCVTVPELNVAGQDRANEEDCRGTETRGNAFPEAEKASACL